MNVTIIFSQAVIWQGTLTDIPAIKDVVTVNGESYIVHTRRWVIREGEPSPDIYLHVIGAN